MRILFLIFILLSNFENIKKESLLLDESNQKSIVIITGYLMCHNCCLQLDSYLTSIKERKFKYFVLLDAAQGVINRKEKVMNYRKDLHPDSFIFCKNDSIYKDFINENNIKYLPALLFIDGGKTKIYFYNEIFKNENSFKRIEAKIITFNEQ
jgi:glycerol-3-phosphate responsive antiterminator